MHGLIIGAGMYTCGRGTDGYGTVMPALLQAAKAERLVDRLAACATSRKSVEQLAQKAAELSRVLHVDVPLDLFPKDGTDDRAFLDAIEEAKRAGRPFDFAVVAVPDHRHYEIAKVLLEHGIHTLLVKPFVTRTEDARDLIRLAEQSGLVGMVEFHKRWDHSNLLMRDALRSGAVGDPLYFHIEYSQRKCIPEEIFAGWVRDTNIFQYLGVHYADMVYFLTSALPRRVLAIGQKGYLAGRGIDAFDSIQTIIEWDQGGRRFVSTHLTNWVDPNCTSAMSDQRIKVIGTAGRFECDQKDRGVHLVTDQGGIQHVNPYFSALFGGGDAGADFDGYGYHSFLSFLHAVRNVKQGKSPNINELPTFRSSLVSTAIVEANNQSLVDANRWIDVEVEF